MDKLTSDSAPVYHKYAGHLEPVAEFTGWIVAAVALQHHCLKPTDPVHEAEDLLRLIWSFGL